MIIPTCPFPAVLVKFAVSFGRVVGCIYEQNKEFYLSSVTLGITKGFD
jgi:hypothetical protein